MWIFPTHCNTRPIAAAGRQQNHTRTVVMTVVAGWALLTSSAFAQSTSNTLSTIVTTTTIAQAVHLTARIRL